MTALALDGMSSGAGCKGGRAPRKRVHTLLPPVDENRVPLALRKRGRSGNAQDTSP